MPIHVKQDSGLGWSETCVVFNLWDTEKTLKHMRKILKHVGENTKYVISAQIFEGGGGGGGGGIARSHNMSMQYTENFLVLKKSTILLEFAVK